MCVCVCVCVSVCVCACVQESERAGQRGELKRNRARREGQGKSMKTLCPKYGKVEGQ